MVSSCLRLLTLLVALLAHATAFAPAVLPQNAARTRTASHHHHMLPPDAAADAINSLLIATIDSDIANIPDNEFASVFAGGIVVMFGGLFSALFVGWLVDSKNLYANIVAESYAQGANDEEFWKGLSEEEKIKTQELLAKLKASKDGGAGQQGMESLEMLASATSSSNSDEELKPTIAAPKPETPEVPKEKKETGMFSDY